MLEYQLLKWRNINLQNAIMKKGIGDDLLTFFANNGMFSFFMPTLKGYDLLGFNVLTPSYYKLFEIDYFIEKVKDYQVVDLDLIYYNIPLYDCIRLQQRYRYPSTDVVESTQTFTDGDFVKHCSGYYGLQQHIDTQKFTAEEDCYVEITAFIEATKTDGNFVIFNEQETNIISDCKGTNIRGVKTFVKAGETLDFEVCAPKSFIPESSEKYLMIRCDVRVKTYKALYKDGSTSSIMKCVDRIKDGLAFVSYYCYDDAFGFPFKTANGTCSLMLPIHLTNPQYNQSDKIYTKSTGENVVLFSELTKEYDASTDYINERMHEIILVALSCDRLVINGERLTKSDKYEVDWENYTTDENGEKLARATFKLKSNVTRRNSNF